MKKANTAEMVEKWLEPVVNRLDVTVWNVVFEKEGAAWFLRIYLDAPEHPITVSDCEEVSRFISPILDREDPIEQSYYLEVSSAGLGRRLTKGKHFVQSVGKDVTVKTFRPVEGCREFVGQITGYQEGVFDLEIDGQCYSFKVADCAYVKWNDDLNLFAEDM